MSRTTQRRIGFAVFLGLIAVVAVFFLTLQPKSGRPPIRSAGRPVSIPIRVEQEDDDTFVLVPVRIGDHGPYEFALDTGASTTAVNGTVLRAVGAEDTGDEATFDFADGDEQSSHLFRLHRWAVGGVPLKADAVVSDLKHPLDVDGLLGSDQLARFGRVTIDYRAERLIITPRKGN